MRPTIVYIVCTLLLHLPVGGQTKTSTLSSQAELARINSYTTDVDRFIKSNRKRIFGDMLAHGTEGKSSWREFKTEAARKKSQTGDDVAFVWTRNGKVVGANFTFTSQSGDWAHYAMYYFREDGTLAKIDAQLNTFYGNLSIIRQQYYDVNGKQLKATRKYLDLFTKKPVRPTEDFFDNQFPVYQNVTELPFRKLL